MLSSLTRMDYRALTLFAGVFLFSIASAAEPEPTAAQTHHRALERYVLPFEPIEITSVTLKGKPIQFNAALPGDADWLQGLTFQIKNISGKPISYVRIELRVDPPESGNLPMVTGISAGSAPFSPRGTPEPAKTFLAPNDLADIPVTDAAYDVYKNALQASTVRVQLGMVFFVDGTAWSAGVLLKRDAKIPNRWVIIDESEKRLEEYLRKRSSYREPADLTRFTSPFQPVGYKPEPKKAPSTRQWDCGGCHRFSVDLVFCELCVDSFKSVASLTSECGLFRLKEEYANCWTYT